MPTPFRVVCCALLFIAPLARGQASVSATGTFTSNSGQFYDFNFGVAQAGTPITIKTYSYDGGTNSAGQSIAATGFDSVLALFNGSNTQIAGNDDLNDNGSGLRDSLLGPTGVGSSLLPPLAVDNYRVRLTNFNTAIGSGAWSMDLVSSGSTSFTFNSGTPSASAQLSMLTFGSSNPAVPMIAQLGSTGPAVLDALTFASGSVGTISGGGYSAPQINVQGGATLNFTNNYLLTGQTLNATGGVVNFNGVQVVNNGTISQTGGAVNVGGFFLGGSGPGTSVTYNLSGGTLTSPGADFANTGGSTITFNLSGGTWNASAGGVVLGGLATGGACYLNVTGGSATASYMTLNAQPGLDSTVTQTNGTVNVAGQLGFQNFGGGNNLYTLNGGTLIANSINFYGSGGSATLLFQRGYLGITNVYSVSDTGILGGAPVIGPMHTLAVTNGTDIDDYHTLTLDGGTLSTGFFSLNNNGTFIFNSGTLVITRNSGYVLGGGLPFDPLPSALVLNSNQAFNVTKQLSMNFVPGVSITVNGGQLDAGTLLAQGPVTVNSGLLNAGTYIQTIAPLTVNGGQVNVGSLNIEGGGPNVVVNGGELSAGSIELDGAMSVNGGVAFTFGGFHVAGQLAIGANGIVNPVGSMTIDGNVQLGGGNAQIGAATVTLNSSGLLQGSGVVFSSGITNGGTIRAFSGDTLRISLGTLTNNKLVDLEGGLLTLEVGAGLNNGTTGLISGRGSVNAAAGINNSGTIALSGGLSDFHGALTNNSGAKTIVTGGSTSTFYDNVTNSTGSEFRVSTNSTAVFLGNVTGLGQFTGTGIKDFEAGASPGPLDTAGSTIVGPSALLLAQHVREVSLQVEGVARIAANGTNTGTSRVNTLTIDGATDAWTGMLDLNDNDLVIDYTGNSPLATVQNQIMRGSNNGAWNGSGITSSLAGNGKALGYAANAVLGLSTFSGQAVDPTSVLVKYTYAGDANLDGQVDVTDLGALATNWQMSNVWTGGDFNYDGFVDVTDLGMLATNWQQGVGSPLALSSWEQALASVGLAGLSVPEPTACGILTILLAIRGFSFTNRGRGVCSSGGGSRNAPGSANTTGG